MNRLFLTLGLLFIFIVPQAWGATANDSSVYQDNTFNKTTDWFHTLGKNPKQAKLIKKQLHNARVKARIHKKYLANRAKMKAWQNSQNNP